MHFCKFCTQSTSNWIPLEFYKLFKINNSSFLAHLILPEAQVFPAQFLKGLHLPSYLHLKWTTHLRGSIFHFGIGGCEFKSSSKTKCRGSYMYHVNTTLFVMACSQIISHIATLTTLEIILRVTRDFRVS